MFIVGEIVLLRFTLSYAESGSTGIIFLKRKMVM